MNYIAIVIGFVLEWNLPFRNPGSATASLIFSMKTFRSSILLVTGLLFLFFNIIINVVFFFTITGGMTTSYLLGFTSMSCNLFIALYNGSIFSNSGSTCSLITGSSLDLFQIITSLLQHHPPLCKLLSSHFPFICFLHQF